MPREPYEEPPAKNGMRSVMAFFEPAPQETSRLRSRWARLPRLLLRAPILVYRYTLSSVMGRQCRYLPTCSEYADTAIARHGAWAGGWMAAARICRCHPWGGNGFDPVPDRKPAGGRWDRPWRYGDWTGPKA
ncbi:MAG: membrane protein insertion efficiency factor YidD [Pseudomonadota bacterium]